MMKTYAKPMILANDELAEGIYAASGDCWTVNPVSVQAWNGAYHVFEIQCTHLQDAVHISSATRVTLTFSDNLTDADAEFPCEFSGNTVTVTRDLHGNAYKNGDTMTYKVWVKASDQATTEAITCIGATISCTKSENVQGGID